MKITRKLNGKFGPCLLEGDGETAKWHGLTEAAFNSLEGKQLPLDADPIQYETIMGKKKISALKFSDAPVSQNVPAMKMPENSQASYNVRYATDLACSLISSKLTELKPTTEQGESGITQLMLDCLEAVECAYAKACAP